MKKIDLILEALKKFGVESFELLIETKEIIDDDDFDRLATSLADINFFGTISTRGNLLSIDFDTEEEE